MKKWLSVLFLLLLVSGAAWADSSNPTISSLAVTQKTDVSVAYLSSVFGTVSGVLMGTSGQMMGKVLYQFNQGLLVVAGLWLGFTVLQMVFKTVTTGSFMQKDHHIALILVRIALGFSLLIPYSPTGASTGYTLLQGIVMQVTVQGVKLADQIWEYALDYLDNGGVVWARPVQQGASSMILTDTDFNNILGDSTNTPASLDNYDSLGMVQKIAAMEACMVQSSIDRENNSPDDSNSVYSPGSVIPLSIYEDMSNNKFEFPGGPDTSSSQRNTDCGQVYWSYINKKTVCTVSTDASGDNSACGFSHLALKEVVFDLLPAVKKYVCQNTLNADKSTVCSDVAIDSTQDYMPDTLLSVTINYQNLIDPLIAQDLVPPSGNGRLNFIPQAKKDGWIMAGRYYWDLMHVGDSYDSTMSGASYSNYIPPMATSTTPGFIGPSPVISNSARTLANGLMNDTTEDGKNYIGAAQIQMQAYTGAASAGNSVLKMSGTWPAGGNKVALWMRKMTHPLGGISDIIQMFSKKSGVAGFGGIGADPILWMHQLGVACLSFGLNFYFSVIVIVVSLSVLLANCTGIASMGAAWKGFDDFMRPVCLLIAGVFILLGVVLGFWVPLYPLFVFTFGVLSFFILVIEAMVAAPLVAFGMTHPEGHDFLGRAQQAGMLLLGVFLRPSLMLLGLFAGGILCYVMMSFWVYAFSGFAADIFYPSGTISGASPGVLDSVGMAMGHVMNEPVGTGFAILFIPIIVFILFLVVFTMGVYTITVNSFSLVYHLPDYVWAWIGAPNPHTSTAQMVETAKGGVTGVGQELQRAASSFNKRKEGEKGGNVQVGGNGNQPQ